MGDSTGLSLEEIRWLKEFIFAILTEREKQEASLWTGHRETHRVMEQALMADETRYTQEKAASNEWRAALGDTLNRGVQRADYEARQREVDARFETLRLAAEQATGDVRRIAGSLDNRLGNLEGRLTGAIAALSSLIILAGLIEHFLPK